MGHVARETPYAPLVGVETAGVREHPDTVHPTMDALDRKSRPVERSSTAEATDWEGLGRVLLAEALQYRGDVLRERWTEIARKASSGEPVTREDWARLSGELQQFAFLVEEIEEATLGDETKTAAEEGSGR